jgi:hypothetical protein
MGRTDLRRPVRPGKNSDGTTVPGRRTGRLTTLHLSHPLSYPTLASVSVTQHIASLLAMVSSLSMTILTTSSLSMLLTRDLARWLPLCLVLAGSGMRPVAYGPHWPRLPPPASPAPTSLACPHAEEEA